MTKILSGSADKSSRLAEKFRRENRLQHILLNPNRPPHEERIAQKILRAMRAQGRIPRRRPIVQVQGVRSVIRRTVRRVRARRTAPATAARAADSGGTGDPDPEPPQPHKAAVLAVMGGAL